jgi:hypothetical protein
MDTNSQITTLLDVAEGRRKAPKRTRMLWYYDAIIDWMIANPSGRLSECAAHIGRTQATLSVIINSDMFKAALAERRAQFVQRHDLSLIEKTTKVANASLDALLEVLDKKRDKIPIGTLVEIQDSALSRLGYGAAPASPSVQVNVNNTQNNATVVAPVSLSDLEEARMALRQVQSNTAKLIPPRSHSEAEPVLSDSVEVFSAPSTDAT